VPSGRPPRPESARRLRRRPATDFHTAGQADPAPAGPHATALRIRPYRPGDRAAVRRICFETGYMGSPPPYWPHEASFADVFAGYYTDREPESLFVAELRGRVVGYLTGCVDSRHATPVARAMLRAALRHGLPLRRGTAGFLARALADFLRTPDAARDPFRNPRWPSHLHINLLPEARGLGGGRALMEAWLARLRELGSPGCHLGTLFENHRAIGFFERMGFRRLGPPRPVPGLRAPDGSRHHEQILVRDLREAPQAPGEEGGGDP